MKKTNLISKYSGRLLLVLALGIGIASSVSAVSVTNQYNVTGAGGHVIWLPNISPTQFPDNTALNLVLTEFDDGTAQLRGKAVDGGGTNGFDIFADFSGLLEPGDVGYVPSGSPKLETPPPGGYDTSNWRYYTGVSGYIEGIGSFSPKTYYLGRYGPSFQIGLGANLKGGAGLGASGWLALFDSVADRTASDPLPLGSAGGTDLSVKNGNYDHGDFNLNLESVPDSGATALLLGMALLGLVSIRGRNQ